MKNARPDHAKWENVIASMKALHATLNVTANAAERAEIYEFLAKRNAHAAAVVDLSIMPALDADGGQSYTQVYAESAALLLILAAGERLFGQYRPGTLERSAAPRAERELWEQYLSSTDRNARAETLIRLYDLQAARVGYEAASVLNLAARSEKAIAVPSRLHH